MASAGPSAGSSLAKPRSPVLFPANTPSPASPSSPPAAAASSVSSSVSSAGSSAGSSRPAPAAAPRIMVDIMEGFRCPTHPRKRRQRSDLAESGSPQLDCDCEVGELSFERLMLNLLQHRGGPIWQALVNPLTPKHRLVLPQTVPDQWLMELLTGASVQQLRDFQAAHPHLARSSFQSLWRIHYEKLSGRHPMGAAGGLQQQPRSSADSAEAKGGDDGPTDWEAQYDRLQAEKEMAWKKKTKLAAQEQERIERKRKETATTKDLSPEESAQLEKKKRVKREVSAGAGAPAGSSAALLLSKTSQSSRSPMQQLLKNMAARQSMFGKRR